jgi:hypothetical protein
MPLELWNIRCFKKLLTVYFSSILLYPTALFFGQLTADYPYIRLHKKIIRIIRGCESKESCRKMFGELNMLTLYSKYVYSFLCFVISNKDQYIQHLVIHGRTIAYGLNLHPPVFNLALIKTAHIIWV